MKLTDIFIKRPVLATVISLLILIFGLRSINDLPLRQFPKIENTVITVSTVYPGASAKIVQGFITTPLEKSIASAEGMDYMTASSSEGSSTIKAFIELNYDPDKAFTNIMSKVSEARNLLPKDAEQPVIQKDTGAQIALMYLSFSSTEMSPEQITDYISRVVQPKLEAVPGIASAQILGQKTFAMRVWLDPIRMAALNITPAEVSTALQTKNFIAATGSTKGKYLSFNISAATDLHTANEFKEIVIKNINGSFIRLGDIARVELGSQIYDASVTFNGQQAIFIGIMATPKANPLTVIKQVRATLPAVEKAYPPGLQSKIVYDATEYIRSSIHEVLSTIVEATLIVVAVILLFLGSLRAVIIPVVAIPLSLIGAATFMLALGYSLNLLTLLAMVLAIGLVVDDAIVVVENIYRHIEEGLTPLQAAIQGAREIMTPVITMTITLVAVYAPIGFMGGLTGALFKEFAFTLASAVVISGIIALTLSPMLCAKLLTKDMAQNKLVSTIDRFFERVKNRYQILLQGSLNYRPVTHLFAGVVLCSCFSLYLLTPKELAPDEDQGVLFMSANGPQSANIDYMEKFSAEFDNIFHSLPAMQDYFIINGMGSVNNIIAGAILKPWDQRTISQKQANEILNAKLGEVAGLQSFIFPLPSLPVGGDGLPIEFVLTSTTNYQ
jgi:multidrug efflux pump